MIEAYEAGTAPAFELYGLGLEHKHVPELQQYAGLTRRPIFVPSVGNFRQGMMVCVPLHLDALPGKPTPARSGVGARPSTIAARKLVRSCRPRPARPRRRASSAEALNGTDTLELLVFGNAKHRQAVLVARLDNLGKGAAGAAVQNIGLMLGVATVTNSTATVER